MRFKAVLVCSVLLLFPLVGAESVRPPFLDAPTVWYLDGDATADCETWAPPCRMKLAPAPAGNTAREAHATAIPPKLVALPRTLSWTFVGSRLEGWSDVDALVTMADGTSILLSHSEDRTANFVAPNNGMTLVTANARDSAFAWWEPLREYRVTLAFEGSTVRAGLGPAESAAPTIWSSSIPLPATAVEIRAVEFRAFGYGKDSGGPVNYWFGDVRATADAIRS